MSTARGRRKVAARHALAGYWRVQPKPMFGSGRVHNEVGAHTDAMSYGGTLTCSAGRGSFGRANRRKGSPSGTRL